MSSSQNNKMVLVNERELDNSELSLSEYFREKRKALQDSSGDSSGDRKKRREYYPMDNIAASLNTSTDMLQQKLYGKKPMTRDWLIAICAAHGLDDIETDEALTICDMPRLDDGIAREDFLIDYLCEHVGDANGLEEINFIMRTNGFSELDTNRRKGKNNVKDALSQKKSLPYIIARKVIRTYLDEGDQYDSLETAYDFRYRCVAAALLEKEGNIKYVLEAFSDGHLSVKDKDLPLPQIFESVSETGEFQDYFSELVTLVKQEQRKVNAQLNDTRNYQGRLGASLENNAIHIFYEQYNYAQPERNEYYLMEYVDGHLKLSVSNQSMFMTNYLSENEYKKLYGTQSKTVSEVYNSLDEIVSSINDIALSKYHRGILSIRRSAFKELTRIVIDALGKIRNRTLFIRNFEMIWDNPGDVCKYFGLEKEFDCTYEEEHGEIILGKEEANLIDENGHSIIISFQELKRAFELGFTNTDQICRVKMSKGSIEGIL